jgi:hypothetical protein
MQRRKQNSAKRSWIIMDHVTSARRVHRRSTAISLLLLALAMLSGCAPTLTPPVALASPYAEPRLWAVVPLSNESGVSMIDTARIADLFAQEAEQVSGIDMVPVNRVILAMRQLDMRAVVSAADALALIDMLDVDGLVVGTVTAYDPYRPPTLGMAVQLFTRGAGTQSDLDPRALTISPVGEIAPGGVAPSNPVAQATGVFDASNHETLQQLSEYATGRSEPESAFGKDIYLVNMELYTKFVSYRLLRGLLGAEFQRLAAAVPDEGEKR